jgi:hypothetical protein
MGSGKDTFAWAVTLPKQRSQKRLQFVSGQRIASTKQLSQNSARKHEVYSPPLEMAYGSFFSFFFVVCFFVAVVAVVGDQA